MILIDNSAIVRSHDALWLPISIIACKHALILLKRLPSERTVSFPAAGVEVDSGALKALVGVLLDRQNRGYWSIIASRTLIMVLLMCTGRVHIKRRF